MTHERSAELEYAQLRAINTLSFLENLLPLLCYEQLTLAEIVAGTLVYRMPELGIAFNRLSKIECLVERLLSRPTWQQIELQKSGVTKRRMK